MPASYTVLSFFSIYSHYLLPFILLMIKLSLGKLRGLFKVAQLWGRVKIQTQFSFIWKIVLSAASHSTAFQSDPTTKTKISQLHQSTEQEVPLNGLTYWQGQLKARFLPLLPLLSELSLCGNQSSISSSRGYVRWLGATPREIWVLKGLTNGLEPPGQPKVKPVVVAKVRVYTWYYKVRRCFFLPTLSKRGREALSTFLLLTLWKFLGTFHRPRREELSWGPKEPWESFLESSGKELAALEQKEVFYIFCGFWLSSFVKLLWD